MKMLNLALLFSKLYGFFKPSVRIKVFRLNTTYAQLPVKNHSTGFADACFDLFSCEPDPSKPSISEDKEPLDKIILEPGDRKLIATGLSFAIPKGYWVKFHERSGLANKGIHVLAGVIDSGYTGELKVILYNSNSEPVIIPRDKAIAQFSIEKVTDAYMELMSLDEMEYEVSLRQRKAKGFGSSDGKA